MYIVPVLYRQKVDRNQQASTKFIWENINICKLKFFLNSPAKVFSQFPFKNVSPKKLCCGIVYSFKCNSCNAIYYGKRKHHFYVRAAKHMGTSHFTNKRVNDVISDHLLTCDCNINFNDFTILSKDLQTIFLIIGKSRFM